VIEGLYSISGDVAPVAEIADLCRQAGAYLMVDEAHSFGPYGARGLGCAEDQGAIDRVDFIVGTFSKTLAGIGGFCVSNHAELTLLHFAARPYVFTASSSPASVAGVDAALQVLQRDTSLRPRLWDNVRRARAGLKAAGFEIGPTESPIVPVRIGTAERAIQFWRMLLERGLYVNIVLPPACHADACLLRTSYSAAHSEAEIDRAVMIFAEVGRTLSVIPTFA
jgi:8-amino-7-oxononanoate synthase